MPDTSPSIFDPGVDADGVALLNNPDITVAGEAEIEVGRRPNVLRRLFSNPVGLIALLFLVLLHLAVFVGPFVWTLSPTAVDPLNSLTGPSAAHLFGVDDLGRDELSRLLYGGQVTLIVGFVSMAVMVLLGILIGAVAGYGGGWVDAVLMRFTDAMMAIPTIFFVLVALTVLPSSILVISLVIAAGSWMQVTRVVYGETLRWKESNFVEAARAMGASPWRILARHIIPQTLPVIIVSATLGIAFAILTESAISYLGMGIKPPMPSWGNMLESAQAYVWTAPILAIYPGVAISLVVLAYNVLGDTLRDILDPRITH